VETTLVGRVTGSDWGDHYLRAREEGRRSAIEIGYSQAKHEDVVEDARTHHNNVYRLFYTETSEDDRLLFRTFQRLELVMEDMFMAPEPA
jgi:hypothetical protein